MNLNLLRLALLTVRPIRTFISNLTALLAPLTKVFCRLFRRFILNLEGDGSDFKALTGLTFNVLFNLNLFEEVNLRLVGLEAFVSLYFDAISKLDVLLMIVGLGVEDVVAMVASSLEPPISLHLFKRSSSLLEDSRVLFKIRFVELSSLNADFGGAKGCLTRC